MNAEKAVKAVVQSIVVRGKHGYYAVATADGYEGSITFSLKPTTWLESRLPRLGMHVLLWQIRSKRAGWRAEKARFWYGPLDDQSKQKAKSERSRAMSVAEKLKQLTDNSNTRVGVKFPSQPDINFALGNASASDRLDLTTELFKLWVGAGVYQQKYLEDEAKKVFGEVFEKHGTDRMMYTLAHSGEELRVWYGLPGWIRSSHADSEGRNLLFEVRGNAESVSKYLCSIQSIYKRSEVKLPIGCSIFLSMEDYSAG